jgi:plastocyanin
MCFLERRIIAMKSLLHKPLLSAVSILEFLVIVAALASAIMAQEIQGKVSGARAGTVVYVDWISGKDFKGQGKHVTMDQKGMTFRPHSLVVLRGTTVDFLNSDAVGHNVYWKSVGGDKSKGNNMGTWPQGQTKSFVFWDAGAVPLLCNVHTEMSGYIFVVPTPYYALTKADGSFDIKGVPQGHLTLKTMGGGASKSKQVDVGAGITNVEL